MKRLAIGICTLAFGALAWSQDATIYILPSQDVVQGKELHARMDSARNLYDPPIPKPGNPRPPMEKED